MGKAKVLFVTQEITPYLKESHIGLIGRHLPQGIQEKGREIRTFMPRFGLINERRNQLHEVIRLSGMNLVIDDSDHPLIIKVASIQSARMQIYFIDNEDYFQRKFTIRDKNEKFYEDNDERSIFFARGVLETVKKLGWGPNIIHCHGWMSSVLPLYLRTAYKDNPIFANSKIVFSLYDDEFAEKMDPNFGEKIKVEDINDDDVKHFKNADYVSIMKAVIDYSDALVIGSEKINDEVLQYLKDSGKPFLEYQPTDKYVDAYNSFYDEVMAEESVVS